MRSALLTVGLILALNLSGFAGRAQNLTAPLPDIRQLMKEVQDHQRQLDKVREAYTYTSLHTIQDIDPAGRVKKTDTEEDEDFFVNGHIIERTVKKNGKPLEGHDLEKEAARVTKLVEKAEKTAPGQPLEGPSVSVGRLLEIMEVRNERREMYKGRPTIVFDFVGRKDAKTHGIVEDASKKLEGTIWIDEGDRQVAHLQVRFIDNFHVVGGIFANIQKGSNFSFEQSVVNPPGNGGAAADALWLPVGGEGAMAARVLLVKNMRQRYLERDYDYKRFSVETQQAKDAKVAEKK
ncbi:MAG TPA: hypothetical protein VKR52_11765 [Terracidiphilus sp.]|nr:hypothetical protein [Terracidiphilus sp.]